MTALRSDIAALRFTLAPLIVYVIAVALFELGGISFSQKVPPVTDPERFGNASTVALFGLNQARVVWLSSVLIFNVVALATLAVSLKLIFSSLSRQGVILFVVLGVGASAIGLAHFWMSMKYHLDLSLVFKFTYQSLVAINQFDAYELKCIAVLIAEVNVLVAIVTFFVMLAGCCLARRHGVEEYAQDPRRLLMQRMTDLKTLINLGSATLVAGSLHMLLWMRWPMAITKNEALKSAIGDWALAVTLYSGIAFSLMIAALYIPCTLALTHKANCLLRDKLTDLSDDDRSLWLDQHGFSKAILQQIPQIVAALAPMFAGPIASAVSGLGNHLTE